MFTSSKAFKTLLCSWLVQRPPNGRKTSKAPTKPIVWHDPHTPQNRAPIPTKNARRTHPCTTADARHLFVSLRLCVVVVVCVRARSILSVVACSGKPVHAPAPNTNMVHSMHRQYGGTLFCRGRYTTQGQRVRLECEPIH